MENLVNLLDYGQSYWLDNLSRTKIANGEIQKRVSEQGLRGITSNPSIFHKAFTSGSEYDAQIEQLAKEGKSTQEIYEALTVKDVQDACDILKPVFDQSGGTDGFVSLEVSPFLARDTQGSMVEARRLYKSVNRPNCFIKIPGTAEGVPAIEEMLYEGVNINITLLFSIDNYEAVALAYVRALQRRAAEGKPLDNIVSVASFFLSRIDVLCDQLLSHYIIPTKEQAANLRPDLLLGKAGIASAKIAYQHFKKIFDGKEWDELKNKGAHVQKVLWASTSTKNPLYDDVIYVDTLIGKDTINTLPEATIAAFADHGTLSYDSIEQGLEEANQVFGKLNNFNIDINFVTQQLENEGIQKFIEAYNLLMEGLAEKRNLALGNSVPTQHLYYGDLEKEMKPFYASLDEMQLGRRLFKQDPYLWKKDKDQFQAISERLGWLSLPEDSLKKLSEIQAFAEQIKEGGYTHVVLLGMGGSSLSSVVAKDSFGSKNEFPDLLILDNTDPAAILEIESQIYIDKTIFIVASKSGSTTETLSFFTYFYELLKKAGVEKPGNSFVAITDEGTPLVQLAKDHHFIKTFINPSNLGGRYSVLSDFGLVPIALSGLDIKALLKSALHMKADCDPTVPSSKNPGISLGTLLAVGQHHHRDKITLVCSSSISSFGYWLEQLIAESTGKEGKGLIPVNGEQLGSPDDYGTDRIFVHFYLASDDNSDDVTKLKALEEAGNPIVRIRINNLTDLGREFYRWEIAIAVAGAVLGINAFDQPNVEESKDNTRQILKSQQSGAINTGKPFFNSGGVSVYGLNTEKLDKSCLQAVAQSFTDLAKPGDYVALLPYFLLTDTRKQVLQSWRLDIRNKSKVVTTLLAGPRYLHSTGQLHKGGPNTGLYIILTADTEHDLAIPGKEYSFATLDLAEAMGDFKALTTKERRVIHIDLGKAIDKGLELLTGDIISLAK